MRKLSQTLGATALAATVNAAVAIVVLTILLDRMSQSAGAGPGGPR